MGRFLLTCILGCGICALAAWQFGFITPGDETTTPSGPNKAVASPPPNLGGNLFKNPAPFPAAPVQQLERKADPIVVLGTMAVMDSSEIAAPIGGVLMFIGELIPEGTAQVAGVAPFLAEPFEYTKVNHGIRDIVINYRRLYPGQMVTEEQIIAMVDITKILGDLDLKHSKVVSAKADSDGAYAIAEEAQAKLKIAEELYAKRAIALDDYRSAQLTATKMRFDHLGKIEAWKMAQTDENISRMIYRQHEIHNKIPVKHSIIQKINKSRGGAVKELEPVMELASLDRLKAEAQIDRYYGRRLRDGMMVTVEPSVEDSPPKTYRGHVSAVNCLAVTPDLKNPLIVSGGEDRTVMLWNRFGQNPVEEFKHPEPVKALACSPAGSNGNLLLTACADSSHGSQGYLRLYDLNQKKDKALIKEINENNTSITALAFSADGKYFASGDENGSIIIWTTDKMEPLYPLDEKHGVSAVHHGAITSLHFTPQGKLVSASLDNTIHVWSLKEKGAVLDFPRDNRSGSINGNLDVSSDGRWMLFDQGKTLQILSVQNGLPVNTLQNPGGVIPFETVALFSPDTSMLLTAGASEGRLQLWQSPTESSRGFEIRQFATREKSPVSCAAFAPRVDYNGEGSFAVSANKDGQIYLWPLPSREEMENHPIRNVRLRLPNAGLNSGTQQFSIEVEIPNPPTERHPKGRLEPNRPVTIVID